MFKAKKTTDFGFTPVDWDEKQGLVNQVFDSVSSRYDLMNDLMSLGLHRLWKKAAIHYCGVRPGHSVLDLASGTGDLARELCSIVGPSGQVTCCDINSEMTRVGRERSENAGLVNLNYALGNAESLPFKEDHFDVVTISFGLRNVRDKPRALSAIHRVLKKNGTLAVLEFSTLTVAGLKPIYDFYSFKILPKLGACVAKDSESYRYLAESIRQHPDQESLRQMILDAGFSSCHYHNLTAGVVALHLGTKT